MMSGIWGLLAALPKLLDAFGLIYKLYQLGQIESAKASLRKAVDDAINSKNQIELEKEIGSDNAGLPTKNKDGVRTRPVSPNGEGNT